MFSFILFINMICTIKVVNLHKSCIAMFEWVLLLFIRVALHSIVRTGRVYGKVMNVWFEDKCMEVCQERYNP